MTIHEGELMGDNIFKEAKQLLDKKDNGAELTEDELELINIAIIPMNLHGCPLPEDIPIGEGLEVLAKMMDGEKERS